jgi:hypothetical protein
MSSVNFDFISPKNSSYVNIVGGINTPRIYPHQNFSVATNNGGNVLLNGSVSFIDGILNVWLIGTTFTGAGAVFSTGTTITTDSRLLPSVAKYCAGFLSTGTAYSVARLKYDTNGILSIVDPAAPVNGTEYFIPEETLSFF